MTRQLEQVPPAKTIARNAIATLTTTKQTISLNPQTQLIKLVVEGDSVMIAFGDTTPTTSNMTDIFLDGFQDYISAPTDDLNLSLVSTGTSKVHVIQK